MGPIWGRQDPGGPHVASRTLLSGSCMWLYVMGSNHIFICFLQVSLLGMSCGLEFMVRNRCYIFFKCMILQILNSSLPSAAYMHQGIGSALVQIVACHLFGAKPLSIPMLLFGPLIGTSFSEILIKIQNSSFTKMHLKTSSAKWQPFCSACSVEDEFNRPTLGWLHIFSSFPLHPSLHQLPTQWLASHIKTFCAIHEIFRTKEV